MVLFPGVLLAAALMADKPAEDPLLNLRKPEAVAQALQQAGYRAEIKTSSKGDTYIASAANGQNFSIQFYDCGDDGCNSLQFYSWYKKQDYFSPALTNDWNAHKRFLKVAIDDDGDLSEYLDVSTVGGMTQKNFDDLVDWFAVMDAELAKFLDERSGKASTKTAPISTSDTTPAG
ncbi:YbjN domain-containing protein [Hephaestia sp. GCM10023244]|uniref:YbjN domain-containing protein n=1 Tax=unclassified Hephaestia TaxID=2631281 RepID=UPI0020774FD6|nr:YbjN domain-containing protein [Hephaestia sp. MAHUQ-44]MCM8731342.1 YbjN domain-containing protein [Hephaestia sp. MAHUQ-44]